ncbi:MAG: hypothetical protein JXA04_00310 [Gammaproteobacteria bacterium]|nr:hypothetical protein [Gammaproteobacteria bacterium]
MYKIGFVYLGREHDEYGDILRALRLRNIDGELIHLDDAHNVEWSEYDLVTVRNCRGIHLDPHFVDKVRGLQERLNAIKGKTISIYNPLSVIPAAVDKYRYLRELEQQGVETVPTYWLAQHETLSLEQIMLETGWNKIVVKPTISTLCWRSYCIEKQGDEYVIVEPQTIRPKPISQEADSKTEFDAMINNDDLPYHERIFNGLLKTGNVCVQKFLPTILNQGETSFVFLGGKFSHAIHKQVKEGDGWVAHEVYGGTNTAKIASGQEIAWAENIYKKVTDLYGDLLYGRVDGIPDDGGTLKLLECELVVPRLFLKEANAIDRYADEILRILENKKTRRH